MTTNTRRGYPLLAKSKIESGEPTSRANRRKRTASPAKLRTSAVAGTPGAGYLIFCGCNCGEQFEPRDNRQKFLGGHRFKSYTTHRCPSCGVSHRQGVNHA